MMPETDKVYTEMVSYSLVSSHRFRLRTYGLSSMVASYSL